MDLIGTSFELAGALALAGAAPPDAPVRAVTIPAAPANVRPPPRPIATCPWFELPRACSGCSAWCPPSRGSLLLPRREGQPRFGKRHATRSGSFKRFFAETAEPCSAVYPASRLRCRCRASRELHCAENSPSYRRFLARPGTFVAYLKALVSHATTLLRPVARCDVERDARRVANNPSVVIGADLEGLTGGHSRLRSIRRFHAHGTGLHVADVAFRGAAGLWCSVR